MTILQYSQEIWKMTASFSLQDVRKEFKETAFELHFQERVDMGHVEIDGQELS